MYRSVQDFLSSWKEEENLTLKIFANITEEAKSVKVNENIRSLERLAWHITQTLTEMTSKAGLLANDDLGAVSAPSTISGIIDFYKRYSNVIYDAIRNEVNDHDLEKKVPMYGGEDWKIGRVLSILILHQAHHRSQMTIIMRVLGLPVPGLYGPSKEEWEQFGMPAME